MSFDINRISDIGESTELHKWERLIL